MADLHITMPMGLGDVHWVLMKMKAFREHVKPHRLIAHIAHGPHHRSTGFVELTDFFDEVRVDNNGLRGVPNAYMDPKWSTIDGSHGWHGFDFCFQANGHLERGERIETWLPELETQFSYTLHTNLDRCKKELGLSEPRILLYPSGIGPNNGFKTNWRREQWQAIVDLLNHHGHRPTFVGADTQDDMGYMRELRLSGDLENLVGRTTTEEYLVLIQNCRAWFGLNSGGGILSGMMGRSTVMLWSDSDHGGRLHPKMATSWLPLDQNWYHWFSYGKKGMEQEAAERLLEVLK